MKTQSKRYSHRTQGNHRTLRYYLLLCAVFLVTVAGIWGASVSLITHQQPDNPETAVVPAPETSQSEVLGYEDQISEANLQELVEEWVSARPDNEWSVVVRGLEGDSLTASVNSEKPYETASMYKLFMSYPLLQIVPLYELGSRSLELEGKEKKTFSECLDLMLRVSHNPCGEAVSKFVTYKKADDALHQRKYLQTNLNRPEYMITTAGDTASFLADLYEGRLFRPAERERVLSILKQQQIDIGIPSGCSDCVVMNKTGDWNGVRHDAGIIQYDTGAYVISIFSGGGSYTQFADLTYRVHEYVTKR